MVRSRTGLALWITAALLGGIAAPLGVSGGQVAGDSKIFAYLDSADGVPGAEVTLPLTLFFTGMQQAPLRKMRATVCVAAAFVHFDRVDPGLAGQAAGATATIAAGSKSDGCARSTVQIDFARPPQRGTLARLVFRIDEDAAVGTRVLVKAEFTAETISEQELKIPPSENEIGIVENVAIPACFFYMH